MTSPQGAYTTSEMVALERENIALMREGLGRAAAIAPNDQVESWAVKRGLLPDQAAAAEITVCATDWIPAIEGRAGTAKTTTVGAIKRVRRQVRVPGARVCADHSRGKDALGSGAACTNLGLSPRRSDRIGS